MAKLRVRYFKWRAGRPRWEPGPKLRSIGLKGVDLKDAAGTWLGEGAAIEAAQRLNQDADAARAGHQPVLRGITRTPRTIEALWDRFEKSSKFTRLAVTTRVDYRNKARIFLDGFAAQKPGTRPDGREIRPGDHIEGFAEFAAAAIDKPVMYGYSEILSEQKGKAMALGIIAVARRLMSFAELIGWRAAQSNPAFGLDMRRPAPRLRLWTPVEVEAFVAVADAVGPAEGFAHGARSIGDAVVLALHSGQRQADVLTMPDWIVDKERIRLSQFKTGVGIDIKMMAVTKTRLAAAKARALALTAARDQTGAPTPIRNWGNLVTYEGTGQAYNGHTFRHLFARLRTITAQGIHGKLAPCPSIVTAQFLDLRDTAITRLALAGCDKWQISSISGHSFASIDTILRHYMVLGRNFSDPAIDKLGAWMEREGIAL